MWRQHILPSPQRAALIALFISSLIIISILYAPIYLNYADQPIKADAVVLFMGPDLEAREKRANKLLEAGYADYLIIPAYGRLSMKMPHPSHPLDGGGRGGGDLNNDSSKTDNAIPFSHYPCFYEATHIEILEAKRIMDHSGFKKANFVSSPSHMRRIKMITDHVFEQKNSAPVAYQIKFVPANIESSGAKVLPWDLKNIGNTVYEYVKIVWFCSYNAFNYNFR